MSPTERLFVALPVPADVADCLLTAQPEAGPGIRLSHRADLHITLHFLGHYPAHEVAAALRSVKAQAFFAAPGGCGQFEHDERLRVLWVGVELSEPLRALHAATGRALAAVGFRPEARPYQPHITLARLGAGAPAAVASQFLAVPPFPQPLAYECQSFGLYASENRADGPRYRLVEAYPLS